MADCQNCDNNIRVVVSENNGTRGLENGGSLGTRDLLRHRIPAARHLDIETKPRLGSCTGSVDRRRYAESLDTGVLTGSGCLTPKDILFRAPPLPVQPPRLLTPETAIQKAHSTPDIASVQDTQLDRAIPVEILTVMKRLSIVAHSQDDVTLEPESEDSYVMWSDDDVSVTSSTNTTPTGYHQNKVGNVYECYVS